MDGGGTGSHGAIRIDDGNPLPRPQQVLIPRNGTVTFTYPGGGYGNPYERDAADVLEDVRLGFVSPARTPEAYDVVLCDHDTRIDQAATRQLRASG